MGPDAALDLAAPAAAALAGVVAALLAVVAWVRRRTAARGRLSATGPAPGEDRLSGVLAACRDAVVLHSPAGRVLSVNPAASRLFGLAPESLVGRPAERPAAGLGHGGRGPDDPPGGLRPAARADSSWPGGVLGIAIAC